MSERRQELLDRMYVENGPCCAGCDWWVSVNSLVGECHRSAPVSAEERFAMVRMDWHSYRFREPGAGHILTNREHKCGDFKDGYDWTKLPAHYLERIGYPGKAIAAEIGKSGSAAAIGKDMPAPGADGGMT